MLTEPFFLLPSDFRHGLLRQNLLDFLFAEIDLMDGIPAVVERDVVVIDIRGEEHLRIPNEALARGDIRYL